MLSRLFMALALPAVLSLCAAARGADIKLTGPARPEITKVHPRIWLDETRVQRLCDKVKGKSVSEVRELAGDSAPGLALVYVITGDETAGREAVAAALQLTKTGRGHAVRDVAVCYDWCHRLLGEEDKTAIVSYLVDTATRTMDFARAYRSFHNGMYSNGTDVGLAALALYHDHPAGKELLDRLLPEWEDSLKVFERLFPDGEWPESFDYDRHSTYEAFRFYWALKTAGGRDVMAESTHMKNTVYNILYSAKPNGLVLPNNDNDWPHLMNLDREALLMIAAEYRDPYAQHFLNHCPAETFQPYGGSRWKDLLWYDPSIPEKAPDDLPLSRIFRGQGLVVARSGWGWDAPDARQPVTWLTFRCGDYFGDHCHYDINAFQIYHQGELAIDSGRYDPDWGHYGDELFKKSQFFNYYQRTIAHNTILVYDPDEKFNMPIANDGGQRQLLFRNGRRNVPEDYDQGTFPSDDGVGTCDWTTNPGRWETGDLTAYTATKDFTYVCGDATPAYSAHKMKSFIRQLLFIQPNVVVVFDRVVSTKPELKKTWLLHSIEEPSIGEGDRSFEFSYGTGRLVCVPLLPKDRVLAKVGGPGNEFLVGDKRFKCGPDSPVAPSRLHHGELPGAWRVEESPSKGAAADCFLNVILLTDEDKADVPGAKITGEGEGRVQIEVSAAPGLEATVTFAKTGRPRAVMRLCRDGITLFEGEMPEGIVPEEGRPE